MRLEILMRQRHRRSLVCLPFVVLLFGLAVLPGKAWACGGATPCECGDFLDSSRTLVFGVDPITVTPCPDNGLFIERSNLTLDLGGNTIRAAAGACCYGITLNVASGVTVTNGKIVGFDAGGILVRVASRNRFSSLLIVEGGDGIYGLGDDNTIERSVFRRQAFDAISLSGAGTQILNNRIEDSGLDGVNIDIDAGDPFIPHGPAVIARNVILRSGQAGLVVGGDGAVIDRNQMRRSGGDGLALSGTNHRVTRNLSNDNVGNGFNSRVSDSTFDGNRAQLNDLFGMVDDSVGDGTTGTANTYTVHNLCSLNGRGDSAPPGLCF
jgi:hypothetical protein